MLFHTKSTQSLLIKITVEHDWISLVSGAVGDIYGSILRLIILFRDIICVYVEYLFDETKVQTALLAAFIDLANIYFVFFLKVNCRAELLSMFIADVMTAFLGN
jgi:hypothetical protein